MSPLCPQYTRLYTERFHGEQHNRVHKVALFDLVPYTNGLVPESAISSIVGRRPIADVVDAPMFEKRCPAWSSLVELRLLPWWFSVGLGGWW